jgi:hypothetical protein
MLVPVPCIECEYYCKRNSEVTVPDTDIVDGPYAELRGFMSWGTKDKTVANTAMLLTAELEGQVNVTKRGT